MNTSMANNNFGLIVQPDNLLLLASQQIKRDMLAGIRIELRLNEAISYNFALPPDCLVAGTPTAAAAARIKTHNNNCSRHQFIKGCHKYSAIVRPMFTDGSELEVRQNFVTFPGINTKTKTWEIQRLALFIYLFLANAEGDDGSVTDLTMVSSGPTHFQIRWKKPKCHGTLSVANYSVSVIPYGAESGSRQISHWIAAAESWLNVTKDRFQLLGPCTDYIVTVRPLFSDIQWTGNSSRLAVSTARELGDRVTDFSATWDHQEDQLLLSWNGLDCTRGLIGWQLTVADDAVNQNWTADIATHCTRSEEKSSGGRHQIRLLLNREGIICRDSTLVEFDFYPMACVTYRFSLVPLWSEDDQLHLHHEDGPAIVAVAPSLMKSNGAQKIFFIKIAKRFFQFEFLSGPGPPGGKTIKASEGNDGSVLFAWRQPMEHPRCAHSYRSSLYYDSETDEDVVETTEPQIKRPFRPCASYDISVWSVGPDKSLSSKATRSRGFTSSGNIGIFEGIFF